MKSIYPHFAGQWYPHDPSTLKEELDRFFFNADIDNYPDTQRLWGIIAPHAGLIYSGMVAARAYKPLQQHINNGDIVLLFSPSHRESYRKLATLQEGYCIHSVLTEMYCNGNFLTHLNPNIFFHDASIVSQEHAVEMQFPFLSYIYKKNVHIYPFVISRSSYQELKSMAEDFRKAVQSWKNENKGKNVFFIASSDLSHFHSANNAELLDKNLIPNLQKAAEDNDPRYFYQQLEKGQFEACGIKAITLILMISLLLAEQPLKISEIFRSHSGETSGDYNRVVGYLAAALYE